MQKKNQQFYYCKCEKCTSIFLSSSEHPEHADELIEIPQDLSNEFLFKKKLGAGVYGVVFQIYDPSEETIKALKLIDAINFKEMNKEMKRELKILAQLNHKCIVRYFRSGILKNSKVFIIMEECDSNLMKYLEQKKDIFSYENKVNLLLKICKGINYIHHHKSVININFINF